jgi:hypothetical protein
MVNVKFDDGRWQQVGEDGLTEMIKSCQMKIILAPFKTRKGLIQSSPKCRQNRQIRHIG